jgi:hypothetical protein
VQLHFQQKGLGNDNDKVMSFGVSTTSPARCMADLGTGLSGVLNPYLDGSYQEPFQGNIINSASSLDALLCQIARLSTLSSPMWRNAFRIWSML